MTRAYSLDADSSAIAEAFGAQHGPDPWGGGDLTPGTFAPVIIRSAKTTQRVIRPMVWGYPAPNTMMQPGEVQWVPNVRNVNSPFWIGNLRHIELRCLVPATAILGTRHDRRDSSEIGFPSLFAMAGIWRDLTDMPVFAVISVDDHENSHASTPLILDGPQQQIWLTAEWKDAAKLLVAHKAGHTSCA